MAHNSYLNSLSENCVQNTGSKLEKGPYVLSLGNCIVEKVSFSSIKRRSDGPAF